jgi:hypothetical protein
MKKQVREIKKRLMRMENLIGLEELSEEDLKAIRESEEEIKRGEYVTAEQLKKELKIE